MAPLLPDGDIHNSVHVSLLSNDTVSLVCVCVSVLLCRVSAYVLD